MTSSTLISCPSTSTHWPEIGLKSSIISTWALNGEWWAFFTLEMIDTCHVNATTLYRRIQCEHCLTGLWCFLCQNGILVAVLRVAVGAKTTDYWRRLLSNKQVGDRRLLPLLVECSQCSQCTLFLCVGELEVVLDRRLKQDDNRGLGQGVMDNKLTASLYHLLLEDRRGVAKVRACERQKMYMLEKPHSSASRIKPSENTCRKYWFLIKGTRRLKSKVIRGNLHIRDCPPHLSVLRWHFKM